MFKKKAAKLFMAAAVTALTVVGATGCGEKKEIEFWNLCTGPDGENMVALIDGFNATNPEYKIKNVTMEGGDLYTKIPTVVNSGTGIPDLALINDISRLRMFYEQGLLEPVDETLTVYVPELSKDSYRAAAWNVGTWDGKQYSIPMDVGVTGIVYNKDLVDKYAPGALDDNVITVEEMMEILPKAKADGIATHTPAFFAYEQMVSLAKQQGGELFDENDNPTINTPEFKQALQTMKDIIDQGGGSDNGEDNLQLFMMKGSVFTHTGVWDKNSLDKAEDLNWGMCNTLAYDPSVYYNVSFTNQFIMLKDDKRSKEKEKVIAEFLNYVRVHSDVWAKSGQVPASNAVDDMDEFKNMKQYLFIESPEEENAIVINTFRYGGYASDAFGVVLNDVLYGNMSIDDALAQVQKEVEDKIAQAQ